LFTFSHEKGALGEALESSKMSLEVAKACVLQAFMCVRFSNLDSKLKLETK